MTNLRFRGYNRVKFQSSKLNKTVLCRSLLLRDYLIHLEWDENVASYELNPFEVVYKFNEQKRKFRPHLLINTSDNKKIIIRLTSSFEEIDLQTNKIIKNICEERGFIFEVKTAHEIRKEPLFTNLKLLKKYNRHEIKLNHILLCREFFKNEVNLGFGDFIQFLKENNEIPQTAYSLLYHKIIEAELSLTILESCSRIHFKNQNPAFENGRLII